MTQAGLDSLAAVDLRDGLSKRFAMEELSATLIFDYPTIAALASLIFSQQPRLDTASLLRMVSADLGRPAFGVRAEGGRDREGSVVEALTASCVYPGSDRGDCAMMDPQQNYLFFNGVCWTTFDSV